MKTQGQATADLIPAGSSNGAAILAQLERVLSSEPFQRSRRYPVLLRYVVEQTLRGDVGQLKERTLGVAIFKRRPEYDTSADPVVRNTASEVRKRIEGYYAAPGHEGELRIILPVGTYVPEFRHPGENGHPPAAETPRPIPASRSRNRQVGILALTLVAVAVVVAAIRLIPTRAAAERFWGPILQTVDPVLVVTGTVVGVRTPQVESGAGAPVTTETVDPKVFLSVNEATAELASFLRAHGKRFDFGLARNITLAQLKKRPFILRGAFNNPWTMRSVEPFRFYLRFDRDTLIRRIVDRQNPSRQDWVSPMAPGITEDYAIIARAQTPDIGQMMLVIAGLGEGGSAAAMEFLTNPKYLESFAAQAPAGWERRNIELVIQTRLVNEDWGEPRLVATHLW